MWYLLQPLHTYILDLQPDTCGFFWHVDGRLPRFVSVLRVCNAGFISVKLCDVASFSIANSLFIFMPCFPDIQDISRMIWWHAQLSYNLLVLYLRMLLMVWAVQNCIIILNQSPCHRLSSVQYRPDHVGIE